MTKRTVYFCDMCKEKQSVNEKDFISVKNGNIIAQAATMFKKDENEFSFEMKIGVCEKEWEHVCIGCLMDLLGLTLSQNMSNAILTTKSK